MSEYAFGDVEPEDSWDPDDLLPLLVGNLARRLPLLGQSGDLDSYGDLAARLDEIVRRLAVARLRRDLVERDLVRIRHLDDDLALVRRRLAEEP